MLQVDAENETVEISWTNPNTPFPDGSRVPLELRLYTLTEETLITTEAITQERVNLIRLGKSYPEPRFYVRSGGIFGPF